MCDVLHLKVSHLWWGVLGESVFKLRRVSEGSAPVLEARQGTERVTAVRRGCQIEDLHPKSVPRSPKTVAVPRLQEFKTLGDSVTGSSPNTGEWPRGDHYEACYCAKWEGDRCRREHPI